MMGLHFPRGRVDALFKLRLHVCQTVPYKSPLEKTELFKERL